MRFEITIWDATFGTNGRIIETHVCDDAQRAEQVFTALLHAGMKPGWRIETIQSERISKKS